MKCLRSGYCCIQYEVIILIDPDLGLVETNLEAKHTGEICRHLGGGKAGEHFCKIHEHPIYKETPCFAYGQTEMSVDTPCRVGEMLLKPENLELRRALTLHAELTTRDLLK